MRDISEDSISNQSYMPKLVKSLFSEDALTGIADVFLVYTMLSSIILDTLRFSLQLTPLFFTKFIVLQGPALLALAIYLKVYGIQVIKENKKTIFSALLVSAIVIGSAFWNFDSSRTPHYLKFFTGFCLFGFLLGTFSTMSLFRANRLYVIFLLYSLIFLIYCFYLLYVDKGPLSKQFILPGNNPARIGVLNYFFVLCALAYFIKSKRVALKIVSGLIFFACFFFAFHSGIRSALVVFLITLVLYMVYYIRLNRPMFYKPFYLATLVLIVALISLFFLTGKKTHIKSGYMDIGKLSKQIVMCLAYNDSEAYKNISRLRIWDRAFSKFKQNPVWGSGYGTTYYDQISGKDFIHPHNIFLQFLAETGLLGFGTFLLFLVLVIKKSIDNYSRLKGNDRLIFIFYPLSFVFFLLFSSFHFAIHENYLFWFFAGIIVGFDTETHQGSPS